jgi:hypothetical protein
VKRRKKRQLPDVSRMSKKELEAKITKPIPEKVRG